MLMKLTPASRDSIVKVFPLTIGIGLIKKIEFKYKK